MNEQRICPHCRSHPTLELSPRALTHQKQGTQWAFARGRQAGVDRSVAPTARPYAVDVCNACLRALRRLVPPSPACGMVTISHTARFPARSQVHVSRAQVSDRWRARMCADSAQRVRRQVKARATSSAARRVAAMGTESSGSRSPRSQVTSQRAPGSPPGVNARHICTGTGLTPATSAPGLGCYIHCVLSTVRTGRGALEQRVHAASTPTALWTHQHSVVPR